jgi:glycosyltransferase involved in cell wall biosynthesis
MTKVRDLIKDSTFIAAPGFEDLVPDVSVVIPTFRRGDNGLFEKSVKSILNQSFKNFELIIIDDGSTDSTFSKIQHFMALDNRISVIRHHKNIGLPAISEIEAFFKARANRFFYAFDDNEFSENAIEMMMSYLDNNPGIKIAYMHVNLLKHGIIGDKPFGLHNLRERNFIPNPGVILEKSVLEDIGLFDPHVIMIGACDWDLWIRGSQKYSIGCVNHLLCIEKGVTQNDSLGNAYKINIAVIFEYIDTSRNKLLLPKNILEYEVDSINPQLTHYSQKVIVKTLENNFGSRYWYSPTKISIKNEPYVVFLHNNYYNYKHIKCSCKIVFMEYKKIYYIALELILNANVIVIANERNLEKHEQKCLPRTIKLLNFFQKKYFYFHEYDFSEKVNEINPALKTFNLEDDFLHILYTYVTRSFTSVFRRFIKSFVLKGYEKYKLKNFMLYIKLLFQINFCWFYCIIAKKVRNSTICHILYKFCFAGIVYINTILY